MFPDTPSKLELQAPVREFLHCEGGWLTFDVEDIADIQRLKCIVVGRSLGWAQGADEQAHYVLVVTQSLEGGYRTYKRVGVGSIQRRHISFQGGEFEARII